MAEILLSLTIIGVVAAITLPSLTGNINERTWNTQRKALYARFSQALALMPSLNGYGKLSAEQTDENGSITQSAVDTAAETFITEGLSKVMKINNICDSEHLSDCGLPDQINPMDGNTIDITDIKTLYGLSSYFNSSRGIPLDINAAAFETQNGESILVYYNPNCKPDLGETFSHFPQPKMCANFIYDLNGKKGPNTVGKDIGFITALYPTDPIIIAPEPLPKNAGSAPQTEASNLCQKQDTQSRVPNREEVTAMFYNTKFYNFTNTGHLWSSSVISSGESGTAWYQSVATGDRSPYLRTANFTVRCIKRF